MTLDLAPAEADGPGAARYPRLLTPLTLRGGLRLRNRAVVTAHGTGLAADGVPTEQLVAYHVARARGGVGLVVVEHNSVHPTSRLLHGSTICSYDDRVVEPYRRLTAAVHVAGGAVFAQLSHAGLQSGAIADHGYVVGPSREGALRPAAPVRELAVEDLDELVDAYAAAARRVCDGGVDGVEVHLGHGNLLQQFLSPLTNRRTDDYGGSPERRRRFPARVLAAVAAAVPKVELGIRLSAEELIPGGLTCDAMVELVRDLLAETSVEPSYLNVSAGQDMSALSAGLHQSPMYLAPGHLLPYARRFKRAFPTIPVICVGRILTPAHAEAALTAGDADLVGMTRAHIADPQLILKAKAGREEEIAPCIGCNVACLGRLERGAHITCIQSPASGRETTLAHRPRRHPRPGRVVVVGAGPAGLEAAVTAGRAGHDVVVLEAADDVGGQARAAHRLPGRQETAKVVSYRVGLLAAMANVELRCGTPGTRTVIEAERPDLVVLATGSRPPHPDDGAGWRTPEDVLEEPEATATTPHLVYDESGDVVGAGLAELLAGHGHPTTLAFRAALPMPHVERGARAVVLSRLDRAGVGVLTDVAEPQAPAGARLVRVGGRGPARELVGELHAAGLPCRVVGDALVPRGFEHAILEGRLAIEELGRRRERPDGRRRRQALRPALRTDPRPPRSP
jgi:2,4-dienoyl-CoA reductase-like NADH-dependent reductase (Old Yellow Enzyme family)